MISFLTDFKIGEYIFRNFFRDGGMSISCSWVQFRYLLDQAFIVANLWKLVTVRCFYSHKVFIDSSNFIEI